MFFSSRRRHTRCLSDWSSDVCSSDLEASQHTRSVRTEMQIYVINLTRAVERRRIMEQQAQALGIRFHYLAATDGRALTDADRALGGAERRKRISPYPLTDNEVGCWLSHRRAMQQLIDSGQKAAAIVEDDAALSPDFPTVLDAIENLAMDFDFIDL